jgi:glycosyltransferase involved in cell wall biosynthesis
MRTRHMLSVFSTFAVGGPQVRFCNLVAALGDEFSHSIFAMDGAYECAERLPASARVAFPHFDLRKGATISNVLRLSRAMSRARPDILLTHNWGTIEWAMANVVAGIRHVHIEDGFGPEEREGQLRRRVLMRRLFLRRTTVVVPSRTLWTIAREIWKLPERRLRYIANGIALEAYEPRQGSVIRDGLTIGTVAALRPEKNIARLLRAFARLPASPLTKLVVAGDGPERASLEALATTLALTTRVTFVGHTTDVASMLAQCDIFALSSDTEQMPLSVLEAMASGLPVASTDVGDVRQMLATENSPFVVALDETALAQSLMSLLNDGGLRARIGRSNRERAEDAFGQVGMFEAYRAVLTGQARSVASGPAPPTA